jgi:thiamine pyrophosphokinase
MNAVLVANGPILEIPAERLRLAAASADAVIGIDGGARSLVQLGLLPTHVTGDFDSLGPTERDELKTRGAKIIPTPDQDFTDLDKALTVCFETLGASAAQVFGAGGGRLDHLYSNLSTLLKHGRTRDVLFVDGFGETFSLEPGGQFLLDDPELVGRTLSLLALGPVRGITTTGLRWPLTNESLAPGVRDGTLNEIVSETVEITFTSGNLLVMVQHSGYTSPQR